MSREAAEKKAVEIVDAFMKQEFNKETEAAAWLVKEITDAIDNAELDGIRAALRAQRPKKP